MRNTRYVLFVLFAMMLGGFASAQQSGGQQGGIQVGVPGISVSGPGVNAGVRILGQEVVGASVGVGTPSPAPAPAPAPVATLPDLFLQLEGNLLQAQRNLEALMARKDATPEMITAALAVVTSLNLSKERFGKAIAASIPATQGQ